MSLRLSRLEGSSLVISPLARLAKVPLGWAELYSNIWNLLVALKKGLVSSISCMPWAFVDC